MNLSVFKRTNEDWNPSYSLMQYNWGIANQQLVEVIFSQTGANPPIDGEWRIGVWGGDDFGMIKDFKCEKTAYDCFMEIIEFELVTQHSLEALGFTTF